jgi:2-polyprenyl-3-methyl-5-hydroxy-6-metoxy-1,4-benzoquinol methylase
MSGCWSALGLKWASRLRGFDVVCTMEVIKHAADPKRFVAASLVRPGGLLLVSTLNRTLRSFALAIVGPNMSCAGSSPEGAVGSNS